MVDDMDKATFKAIRRLCPLVAASFLLVSCINIEHWGPRAKRERELEQSASMQAGSSFRVSIKRGSISVQGADADECRLTAKIQAYATSKERAETLAEAIQVRLERSVDGLEAVVEAPRSANSADYSVSLVLTLPRRSASSLITGDGAVRVKDMDGSVEARTSDGDVEVDTIKGDVRLKSYNGAVTCSQVEAGIIDLYTNDGNIRLSQAKTNFCKVESSNGLIHLADIQAESLDARTNNGGIRCLNVATKRLNCNSTSGSVYITWGPSAPKSPDITVALTDGSITFVGITDMSAVLDAFSNTGPISADLPGVGKSRSGKSLQTTLGEGGGRLVFSTHDGSITIR
jgi:hypothetical protein